MPKVGWSTAYEVGHVRIDGEHRIFFDLICNLESDYAQDQPTDKLSADLLELKKYADFHFFSEENIMRDIGYPDIVRHKALHANLMNKLLEEIADLERDRSNLDEMVTFLFEWLCSHILTEDTKLAAFVRKSKALRQDKFIAPLE